MFILAPSNLNTARHTVKKVTSHRSKEVKAGETMRAEGIPS